MNNNNVFLLISGIVVLVVAFLMIYFGQKYPGYFFIIVGIALIMVSIFVKFGKDNYESEKDNYVKPSIVQECSSCSSA